MTGPSRERPPRRGRGTGSGGRTEGRCGGDYDDLVVDVDDESDFFFVVDAELSDFFESEVVDDDESDDSDFVLSGFVLSDFESDSEDESDFELPFERLEPLRLSFL
jgi:hypothetical protein